MNPLEIINKYYNQDTQLYNILVNHSASVTQKALHIAHSHPELNIDINFIKEAGMLHDIGIFLVDAPRIQCFGTQPYIAHGYLGHDLLVKEGYPQHALVCERHTGSGLTLDEIIANKLPIPHRDMTPKSIEEKVICFADCFYSKTHLNEEKSIDKIVENLAKYGEKPVAQFMEWCNTFL